MESQQAIYASCGTSFDNHDEGVFDNDVKRADESSHLGPPCAVSGQSLAALMAKSNSPAAASDLQTTDVYHDTSIQVCPLVLSCSHASRHWKCKIRAGTHLASNGLDAWLCSVVKPEVCIKSRAPCCQQAPMWHSWFKDKCKSHCTRRPYGSACCTLHHVPSAAWNASVAVATSSRLAARAAAAGAAANGTATTGAAAGTAAGLAAAALDRQLEQQMRKLQLQQLQKPKRQQQ